ncbi:hypothetical protein [Dehalococcoides mccartyi]|uniref:hypothetical protein n=1 Tax=Dehalococcoides mccartyi TaxID=61435 RepID=UPI000A74835D|nr:hypothetical protein [Dehalococcoides mccartyi]
MSYLENTETAEIITRFVSFQKTQEVIRTVQTALDGTEYLTRFGSPTVHYELTLYVNEAGKAALMTAEDSVPMLECSVKQGVFTGRIVELGSFDYQASGWYKVTATLAAVSEVSDP